MIDRTGLEHRIAENRQARMEARANTRYYAGELVHQVRLLFSQNPWLRVVLYAALTCVVLALSSLAWDLWGPA